MTMDGVPVLQSIFTVDLVNSRTNTPLGTVDGRLA